jgi:hypothetical protein
MLSFICKLALIAVLANLVLLLAGWNKGLILLAGCLFAGVALAILDILDPRRR